ncbi:hypothetical protein TrRE_jg13433 [Triparma retinervis]|uniref:Protein kinase domain-containing protein n=1 Tax=Triparma retinervis TaxID=2557542 RepID=A0A9W7G9H8_9STRA|nr:hypothetical protein TrRE_jg13433 [Triparma retinervis]
MKGFYETEDCGGEGSEAVSSSFSNPSSLVSLVSTSNSCSPISNKRSTEESPGSSGSGSERVRSLYIKSFSFEIDMKELKFRKDRRGDKKMIGEGSHAKILLADFHGTPCAVKRMAATQAGRVALERFQTEIAMMMTLRHPNIVQIFGGCWPPQEDDGDRYCNLFSTCIVMEYCEMGSLFDTVLKYGNDIPWYPPNYSADNGTDADPMLAAVARAASSSKSSSLSSLESNVQFKLDWCRQIARGMAYLHSQKNPVMHRDLKCSNVLVSKGFTLKIADFGESRRRHKTFVLENMEDHTMSQAGTLLFMAPEMLTERDYDIKVDVYSFSILLVELFNNGDLINFYNSAPALVMHKVIGGWRPSLEPVRRECKEVAELVELCWCQNPEERFTFVDILDFLDNVIEETAGIESRRSSIIMSGDV